MNKLAAIARMNPDAIVKIAQLNPLTGGLIGAGLGAGAGAGYTYLTEKDPEQRKNKLKTAIMAGALVGGTGGAAMGLTAAKPQLETYSPTKDEVKYRHGGQVMAPVMYGGATLLRQTLSKLKNSPKDRFLNMFRKVPVELKPTFKMNKGRALLFYAIASALSSLNPEVVEDVAKTQAQGNPTVDMLANPVASLRAFLSNHSRQSPTIPQR